MDAALENCHEILGGCRYHHVFPFDEKFHCTLPSEGSFNNPIGRRPYLIDEGTQLCTVYRVSRIKAKISRVFTNFAA
jgi:hypothetical protein